MGITISNKELSAARIDCNGSFQVKLSLTAAPDAIGLLGTDGVDVSGSPSSICSARNFKARFIAHYIDNDFDCCDQLML